MYNNPFVRPGIIK